MKTNKEKLTSKFLIKLFCISLVCVLPLLRGTRMCFSQNIGINTTGATPNASALLDIDAAPGNSKGLLIPRLTTAQMNAITSPATGLIIYNTDCNSINYYNGAAWIALGNTGSVPTPGAITGSTTPCQNATGIAYSIAAVTGATGYNWTVPTGATVATGQGTTAITVNFATTNGNVCVTAYNACGSSNASCAAITLSTAPAAPTAATHTPSQTQIVWNWNTSAGATGYKYNTVNNYATATDNFASTTYTQTGLTCNIAYTLYVWAYNACGNSAATTLTQTTSSCITVGLIFAWSGTIASIPSGWVLCDGTFGTPDLRTYFVKGAPATADPGGTGGTLTHNHTGITSITTVTTGASGTAVCGVSGSSCSWNTSPASHTHTITHSHTIAASSNFPPYYEVIYIMSTASSISAQPNGIIAEWSGTIASIPTNWLLSDGTAPTVNLINLFLKGAPNATNPGATGGSATDAHVGTTAVDATVSSSYAINSFTASCGVTCGTWGGGHSHTYSHAHTIATANNLPPYYEVAYLWANGASFYPSGIIAQWNGTLATIPSGWVLCDGTLGTPDLRDKYVKGVSTSATNPGTIGGALTHDHGAVTGTDSGGTTSTSGATNGPSGGNSSMSVHNHSVPTHSHTISSDSNEPPYYKIVYIMKQ